MKICITGATGFVGSYLVQAFRQKGIKTVCLLRRESPNREKLEKTGIEIRFVDLRDAEISKNIFSDVDMVFHLAGSVFDTAKQTLFETNVCGTENLYKALKNTRVQRFIFLSSLAAIGPRRGRQMITEDSTPRPISAYGRSKLEAEKRLNALKHYVGKEVCIVRAPLIYGIGMSLQSRLFLFIQRLLKGNLKVIGNGENFISLCQIANLIDFLTKVVDFKNVGNQVFHIADPVSIKLNELVSLTASKLNLTVPAAKIPTGVAMASALFLDFIGGIFSTEFYLSKERVKELTGNWQLDLSKVKLWGYEPLADWESAYSVTIHWLSSQISRK